MSLQNDQQALQKREISIDAAINKYIDSVRLARSENTCRTYKNGLNLFKEVLLQKKIDPSTTLIHTLNEDTIISFITDLHHYAATSEQLYISAVAGFFEFLAAEELKNVNLPRMRLLIHQRSRRPGQRLPQFPKESIDKVLDYVSTLAGKPVEDEAERLRNLRDQAFLMTLADTGLRVHEACNLRRGDIDWNEGQALVIGKGNKQAVVRFSRRALTAMRHYLKARAALDGVSGKPLSALPIFARHDKGAGQKILAITTTSGRNIVHERVMQALGSDEEKNITPHSFRHYFVTRILQSSNNLKLAQSLARHSSINVTQRYAHLSDRELDEGYWNAIEMAINPEEER